MLNVSNGSSKPEEKNNGISIIAKNNEKKSIHIYLYADHMVIEGIRLGCCLYVLKVGPYLQMVIHRMLLLRLTSGESMD